MLKANRTVKAYLYWSPDHKE